MIDGFVDGLSGKSAPFFWLIALILVWGLVSNSILVVRAGMDFVRLVRRVCRRGKTIAAKPTSEGTLK
jgi:hypothetical protein